MQQQQQPMEPATAQPRMSMAGRQQQDGQSLPSAHPRGALRAGLPVMPTPVVQPLLPSAQSLPSGGSLAEDVVGSLEELLARTAAPHSHGPTHPPSARAATASRYWPPGWQLAGGEPRLRAAARRAEGSADTAISKQTWEQLLHASTAECDSRGSSRLEQAGGGQLAAAGSGFSKQQLEGAGGGLVPPAAMEELRQPGPSGALQPPLQSLPPLPYSPLPARHPSSSASCATMDAPSLASQLASNGPGPGLPLRSLSQLFHEFVNANDADAAAAIAAAMYPPLGDPRAEPQPGGRSSLQDSVSCGGPAPPAEGGSRGDRWSTAAVAEGSGALSSADREGGAGTALWPLQDRQAELAQWAGAGSGPMDWRVMHAQSREALVAARQEGGGAEGRAGGGRSGLVAKGGTGGVALGGREGDADLWQELWPEGGDGGGLAGGFGAGGSQRAAEGEAGAAADQDVESGGEEGRQAKPEKASENQETEEPRGKKRGRLHGEEAKKVRSRSMVERERRERISEGLRQLRAIINAQGDTATILEKAVHDIQMLQRRVVSLETALLLHRAVCPLMARQTGLLAPQL